MADPFESTNESPAVATQLRPLPLCVDLDGTLVLSDLLLESLILLVKRNPLYCFLIAVWFLRGRATLKAEVAERVMPNTANLPHDAHFVQWLESEARMGRDLWLCTACNERVARCVATHFGFFHGTIASSSTMNLAGSKKRDYLVKLFGAAGFDYCGNEWRDMTVWKRARGAIVVHGVIGLEGAVAEHARLLRAFPRRAGGGHAIIRVIRFQQWAKNLLILVPLLVYSRAGWSSNLAAALLATASFCLCASSVYVVNDLLDLDADRAHPRKSRRPFASGSLSLRIGLALIPFLLLLALFISTMLPMSLRFVLVGYYVLAIIYSLRLKQVAIVDVTGLSGLYVLRIVAGSVAIGAPLSFFLLIFSLFFFFSLALVKRYAELYTFRTQCNFRPAGRGYHTSDLAVLPSFGCAAGYLSVLALALYLHSPETKIAFQRPEALWILCPIALCWVSYLWLMAQRGKLNDDPARFILADRTSIALGLLAASAVMLAI